MKKALFIFALTILFALGASAQSFPTSIHVEPDSTSNYIEAIDVFDTTFGSTTIYVFDYDSIISIDSIFSTHGVFLGMDTTYLCTDTIEIADTIENLIPDFHNYRAVTDSGWMFDHWMVIVPTEDSNGVFMDTAISYTEFFGDDLDDMFWGDWPGIPDSTDESLGVGIQIIAYFTKDTNCVNIQDFDRLQFKVYPNPTSRIISILGDIHWIQVYNLSGQLITESSKSIVDLSGQPNSTYILRVTDTNGHVGITKIIKY